LRVLVIDDDHVASERLCNLLAVWGHDTRWACDGPAGLAIAIHQRPQVVLLDIAVPDGDGIELARRLRLGSCGNGCFLIALTSHHNRAELRNGSLSDIDLVLPKPVDHATLETLLAMEGRRLDGQQSREPVDPAPPAKNRPFQVGQAVELTRGYLAGLTGVVDHLRDDYKCLIRLNLVQSGVLVSINNDAVIARPKGL
jgi:DNA-binding response OmpR family regulator